MDSSGAQARALGLLGLLAILTVTVMLWREEAQAWRGYQAAAFRGLADQARADLRTLASASDRLAAQARALCREAACGSEGRIVNLQARIAFLADDRAAALAAALEALDRVPAMFGLEVAV